MDIESIAPNLPLYFCTWKYQFIHVQKTTGYISPFWKFTQNMYCPITYAQYKQFLSKRNDLNYYPFKKSDSI